MELSTYRQKFILTRPLNQDLETARIIYEHFKKQIKFPHIMSIQKRIGRVALFEIFSQVIKSDCKDTLKLFLWRTSKNAKEVKWDSEPEKIQGSSEFC